MASNDPRIALEVFLKSLDIPGLGKRVYQGYAPEIASGAWAVIDKAGGGFYAAGTDGCSLASTMVELRVWGQDYPQISEIADAIRTQVQGFSGLMDDFQIWSCDLIDDDTTEVEEPVANAERRLYDIRVLYLMHHPVSEPVT